MVQFVHTQNRVNEGHIFTVCLWTGHPQVTHEKALLIGVCFEVGAWAGVEVAHVGVDAVLFAAPEVQVVLGLGVFA